MRWQRLEFEPFGSWPSFLDVGDICYYARNYYPSAGFSAGHGNSDVLNLKKHMSRLELPEFQYKRNAVRKFATELSIMDIEKYLTAAMPSSKTNDDPDYDPRLIWTLQALKRIKPTLRTVEPFRLSTSYPSFHSSNVPRSPEFIFRLLNWNGLPDNTKVLVIIDDVLTTGAHFKACKMHLERHSPETKLIGMFWTRTVLNTQ